VERFEELDEIAFADLDDPPDPEQLADPGDAANPDG
jgi:hypothetical protein